MSGNGSEREQKTVDLDDLLLKSSRTFALSIPLLPEPTRREVTVAYLLFRIADTFEDAAAWSRVRRQEALAAFVHLLERPRSPDVVGLVAQWLDEPPVHHAGYLELLSETPSVLEAFDALLPAAREPVRRHTARTAEGMAGFVGRGSEAGELRLDTLQDLRDYCYVVAGIVGEMLTELFIVGHAPLAADADALRGRAAAFGEGLQLVNILKDASADGVEGRRYLPKGVDLATVFELARTDLDRAAEYTTLLHDAAAPRGMIAFNALPVQLARATLDRVEQRGSGAKLTRPEVFAALAAMNADLDAGRTPVRPRQTETGS